MQGGAANPVSPTSLLLWAVPLHQLWSGKFGPVAVALQLHVCIAGGEKRA